MTRTNYNGLEQTNELPMLFGKPFIHLRLQADRQRFINPEVTQIRFN